MQNLDLDGLIAEIFSGSNKINSGRKNLATDGLEHSGRLFYEDGIATVQAAFTSARESADPQTMIIVELTFLKQELQFCSEADAIARGSLIQAVQSFDDALRSLKIVENSALYRGAEATYPTAPKYRYQGFPRDAVHLACAAHRTRIQNSLRTPGINMIEKSVLTQRSENMAAIQAVYAEKQRKALA
jgi:hypothetical protein